MALKDKLLEIAEAVSENTAERMKPALAGKVDKAVFPSLTGPFKQAKVPVYASASAIPTAGESVASAFNLGAWSPTAGNYVAFVFLNNQLNAVKTTYDGTSTWTWKEATPLSKGCQVMLEDGGAGHVYITMQEEQTGAQAIYDVVKPLVNRIQIESGASATEYLTNGQELCDYSFVASDSAQGQVVVQITDCSNISLKIDTSRMSLAADGHNRIILQLSGKNILIPLGYWDNGADYWTKFTRPYGFSAYGYGTEKHIDANLGTNFGEGGTFYPRYALDEHGNVTTASYYLPIILPTVSDNTGLPEGKEWRVSWLITLSGYQPTISPIFYVADKEF